VVPARIAESDLLYNHALEDVGSEKTPCADGRMVATCVSPFGAIAVAIATVAAGAGRLNATAVTDACPSLSTVSMYSLGWPEIRGRTNRGQLW
jgi:hypothetical protein